jgi:hypothetical protein
MPSRRNRLLRWVWQDQFRSDKTPFRVLHVYLPGPDPDKPLSQAKTLMTRNKTWNCLPIRASREILEVALGHQLARRFAGVLND